MQTALTRLREPSSYAGLAVLLGLFGVNLGPELLQPIIQIGTGAAALAAILLPEKPKS